MTDTPFVPDLEAIVADLRDDQLHLDPTVVDQVTSEQLSAITASMAAADTPIYVLALPLTIEDELTPIQLVSLVHRELPEDGIWFVTRQSYDESWRLDSTTYGVSTANADFYARVVAEELYPTDLGLQLQKTTELLATGTAKAAYEETFPERQVSTTQPDDDADGLSVGLPVIAAGIGVLALVVAVIAMRRRPGRRHEIVVKGRALRRISTAQTDSWRRRAEDETAQLGDRVRGLEISDASDRDAWTAALDHFEAAGRVLERTTSAADSIGALVLARRGNDALDHAVAGQPWQPTAMCFFNPLHGPAKTTVRWTTHAGGREVPACIDCRRVARKRQEPDFLDLPTGETVVHYVDADAEPWASTGYGSLDPDLLGKLT